MFSDGNERILSACRKMPCRIRLPQQQKTLIRRSAPKRRNLRAVLESGCWSPVETFGSGNEQQWHAQFLDSAERRFSARDPDGTVGQTNWKLGGSYNLENAIAAIAAARSAGVHLEQAVDAMSRFDGVKRRQVHWQVLSCVHPVS